MVASNSIMLSRSLDILSVHRLKGGRLEGYSWVPDWSDRRVLPNALNGYPNKSGVFTRREFHASLDSELEIITLSSIEPLPLRGYDVDSIAAIGNSLKPDMSLFKWNNIVSLAVQSVDPERLLRILLQQFTLALELWATAMAWRQLALSPSGTYPTGEAHDEVFWKTLQATVYIGSEEETRDRHDEFFRGIEARRDRCHKFIALIDFDDPWAAIKAILESIGELSSSSAYETVWKQFLSADVVLDRAVLRRLGRTAKGYLALLPLDAKVTDTIVLLQGGKTPYVIRRRDGLWEFVGDCYVHGIMDGEAWDESRLEDIAMT